LLGHPGRRKKCQKKEEVPSGNGGKPIERYEYTPYGERKIFVDSTPPAVEQVRVKGHEVWVEMSEAVSPDALAQAVANHTLRVTDLTSQEEVGIAVSQSRATWT
jgi:hypothetical protein